MERNSRWVPFVQWLQNQSRSVENDSEDSTVFRATEFLSQGSSSRQLQSNRTEASAAGMRGTSTRAGQPVASDCRAEQRLLDYNMHARQEMSLVLAAPGLPISRAPIVTAKQVCNCEGDSLCFSSVIGNFVLQKVCTLSEHKLVLFVGNCTSQSFVSATTPVGCGTVNTKAVVAKQASTSGWTRGDQLVAVA